MKSTRTFLSHNWGEEGKNHEKIKKIDGALQKLNTTTWFDEERMYGNIRAKMMEGIENADTFVAFITKQYCNKVNSDDKRDSCCFEFNAAFDALSNKRMIAVVMEPSMRDWREWGGLVKNVLGGSHYLDFSNRNFNNKKDIRRMANELNSQIDRVMAEYNEVLYFSYNLVNTTTLIVTCLLIVHTMYV